MIAAGAASTADSIITWGGVASVVAAGLGVLWRVVQVARRFTRKANEFFEDWNGVPDRPGVPGRPGTMERLDQIDTRLGHVEARFDGFDNRLTEVEGRASLNGPTFGTPLPK